jgi:hypothetical protein
MRPHEQKQPRVYIIRRVSGHLRQDGKVWTFLYFCDPFESYQETGYVEDIPGQGMLSLSSWLQEALSTQSSEDHLHRLTADGFGLVVKILRDIKTSWKIFLSEVEEFLENLVRRICLLVSKAYHARLKTTPTNR